MTDRKLLAIYLNDHLAGATGGRELARRTAAANRDSDYGPELAAIAAEVDEDRTALIELMRSLGVGLDSKKQLAGWSAEKLGRLKLNGSLLHYSPLSRVVELEGLKLGLNGKLSLWRALHAIAAAEPQLDRAALTRLARRAERQLERLEPLSQRAVEEALIA